MKNELKERMEKGLENVQKCQEDLKNSLEEKINSVEDRIADQLNLNSLYKALDFRFGQKYSKEYARLQMKTRLQKTGESLQECASEIERLTNLSFSDYPANMRE
ncbi:uncharacterized protein TNCV_1193601 [Trichonephila clavipes]|nr:uncharacterized protein TNCV_1193601 [Trichonephila clavipes]